MSEFRLIKDKTTGHVYPVAAAALEGVDPDTYDDVTSEDRPAVDATGAPVQAKYSVDTLKKKATEDGEDAPEPVAATEPKKLPITSPTTVPVAK